MSIVTALRPGAAATGEGLPAGGARAALARTTSAAIDGAVHGTIHGTGHPPPAAPSETASPVAPPGRGEGASIRLLGDHSMAEASRARLLAAQRAYVAAARAAGYNPLISGIP